MTSDSRAGLLTLARALSCRWNALRRDECGDWRIEGRFGHIYAVPGSLDRPDTPGFQIIIAGSGRWWANAKAALKPFADLANDGDDEGMHSVFRLPTAAEAEIIRHYVGVAKKRVLSDEARERLISLGRRFEKRSDVEGAQTGQNPASDDGAGERPPNARGSEKSMTPAELAARGRDVEDVSQKSASVAKIAAKLAAVWRCLRKARSGHLLRPSLIARWRT